MTTFTVTPEDLLDLVHMLQEEGDDAETMVAKMRGYVDAASPPSPGAGRVIAVLTGIAVLAAPRRTRPLAGVLYGAFLSRVHGSRAARLEATLVQLFDQRTSIHARLARLEDHLSDTDVGVASAASGIAGIRAVIRSLNSGAWLTSDWDELVRVAHARIERRQREDRL